MTDCGEVIAGGAKPGDDLLSQFFVAEILDEHLLSARCC
jgi:hypothetical protein